MSLFSILVSWHWIVTTALLILFTEILNTKRITWCLATSGVDNNFGASCPCRCISGCNRNSVGLQKSTTLVEISANDMISSLAGILCSFWFFSPKPIVFFLCINRHQNMKNPFKFTVTSGIAWSYSKTAQRLRGFTLFWYWMMLESFRWGGCRNHWRISL